jgi:hypothetical protein
LRPFASLGLVRLWLVHPANVRAAPTSSTVAEGTAADVLLALVGGAIDLIDALDES